MAINNGGVVAQIDDTSDLKHRIASSAFAYCHSVDYTATKTADIEKIDSTLSSQQFSLIDGITVHVYFTNSNTAVNPTLNISGTGAFPIYKQGTTPPGQTAQTSWRAGSIVSFTYNTKANSSGCWTMNDHLDDNGLENLKDSSATGSLQGISSTVTNKSYAIAIGDATTASAMRALAEGHKTLASGNPSHAEGNGSTASGSYSHAEGYQTYTSAAGAHAEGNQTTASVNYAHAEGSHTYASGNAAHAEGNYTTASGMGAHAGGYYTQATTAYQTAIGKFNAQNNDALFLVGNGQYNTRSNAFTVYIDGRVAAAANGTASNDLVRLEQLSQIDASAVSSGTFSTARLPLATTAAPGIVKPDGTSIIISDGVISANSSGDGPFNIIDGQAVWSIRGVGASIGSGGQYAAAFGYHSTASGQYSFAEGYGILASGHRSHAEGDGSVASSYAAHAEGSGTASGYISHAEGRGTASESYSHAEGAYTIASGQYSHAGGYYTQATTAAQTAIGKYNAQDNTALFLVGNGTGVATTARNNAFTVYADGRVASSSSATQSTDLVQLEQLNMALDSIPVLPSAQIISAANSGWGSI